MRAAFITAPLTAMMSEDELSDPMFGDTVSPKTRRPRSSSSKHARSVRTSAALVDALLALLNEKPFEQISVREICSKAGLHYGTFFRHVPSKEALLDRVAGEQIMRVVELTLPAWDEGANRSAFVKLCGYIQERRNLWATLLNGGAGSAMREAWIGRARAVAADRPTITPWLPPKLGIVVSVTILIETISWWLAEEPDECSVQEVSAILHRLIEPTITS